MAYSYQLKRILEKLAILDILLRGIFVRLLNKREKVASLNKSQEGSEQENSSRLGTDFGGTLMNEPVKYWASYLVKCSVGYCGILCDKCHKAVCAEQNWALSG